MWPNFLIIGAPKSGTTSLYNYLGQHPEVYVSPVKEPRFFAPKEEEGYKNEVAPHKHSVTDEAAYRRLFDEVTHEKAVGEASPGYLNKPETAARIQHYVPEAKLIAVLRQPVERAYSNYISLYGRGLDPIEDFRKALEAEPRRIREDWSPHWFYRRNGLYARQLKPYFERFGRTQLRIYLFDDLTQDPLALMRDLYRFLNVDDTFVPDTDRRYNPSGLPQNRFLYALTTGNPVKKRLKPHMSRWVLNLGRWITSRNTQKPTLAPQTRRELTCAYYREDILALQDLIDRDLSGWLE